MLRHEVVMQDIRCFFPKGKHKPQAVSSKQSVRRKLAIVNQLAQPPAKGTVLLDSFRARVARERYAREHYAAYRHDRPIRVCRRPPAAPNIDHANGHAATALLICTCRCPRSCARASRATRLRCLWHG